jgi:tetratricopeptide (TPR) repeat protein
VQRYGDGVEGGFAKRYIIRPFQRYRVPLTILAVALAVFGGVIAIALFANQDRTPAALPAEFKGLLTADQLAALDALNTLQSNPSDTEALLKMANTYFDASRAAGSSDPGTAITYAQQGIRYYERYLNQSPQDNDARADLATLYFNSGQTDRAIQEVATVLQRDKNHVKAMFNLAIFYAQGRRDYPSAEAQFKRVIALTKNDPNQHSIYQQAVLFLDQVKKLETQSTTTTGTKQ